MKSCMMKAEACPGACAPAIDISRHGQPFGTVPRMRPLWIPFVSLTLVACGPRAQPAQSEPSSASSTEGASDEAAGESSDTDAQTEETHVTPPSTTPRRLIATRGPARVELEEGTGFLIDGTAPPPPTGSTPGTHPTLHGSCGGDPLGCSEAGNVVRPARTLEEVRAGLEARGFTVVVEP